MPKYQKKRRSRIFNSPKRGTKTPKRSAKIQDDIKMTPTKVSKSENKKPKNMRVVTGKKLERKRQFKSFFGAAAIVLLVVLIFETILPAGIVQTVSNITAVAGTGSYPISVAGSETLNTVAVGNYYYVLTDTNFSAYTNSGKELFNDTHGFEKPVLAVSKGRTLLYDQGGKFVYIYDLRKRVNTVETKNNIITAAISDSGNFAIGTYSDNYASAVSVYNKWYKLIYEWFSAEDTINHVAVSSSGKKLAVATFNSVSGVFNSKVNIINYKSATPENSKSYNGSIIYSLDNYGSRFSVVKSNGIDFIKWSNFKIREYNNDYSVSKIRSCGSAIVAVFCRESDKTDNRIAILSKGGKARHTVNYKGIINDIRVKGSNIYCINDTEATVLNFDGEILGTVDYGFGGVGVVVTAANTLAVVNDNEIKRIKFKKGV